MSSSRILSSQVEEIGTASFVADASDLGWPPGHWPHHVETNLGNGQRLLRTKLDDKGALYVQELGIVEVQVYND
jgi:hypothetical protein